MVLLDSIPGDMVRSLGKVQDLGRLFQLLAVFAGVELRLFDHHGHLVRPYLVKGNLRRKMSLFMYIFILIEYYYYNGLIFPL